LEDTFDNQQFEFSHSLAHKMFETNIIFVKYKQQFRVDQKISKNLR